MKRILATMLAGVVVTSALSTTVATSASAAAPDQDRRVGVRFGQTVTSASGEAVRLVFRGRRGQLVTLRTTVSQDEYPDRCESIVLRKGGHRVVQHAPGLWRLRSTGKFRLDYTQDCKDPYDKYGSEYDSHLTLARVVVGRRGDAVRHGTDRDAALVRAVKVRLGKRPLRLSEAYVVPAHRRTKDAQNAYQPYCATHRLVAGRTPSQDGTACSFRARKGDRYLVFGGTETRIRVGGRR